MYTCINSLCDLILKQVLLLSYIELSRMATLVATLIISS